MSYPFFFFSITSIIKSILDNPDKFLSFMDKIFEASKKNIPLAMLIIFAVLFVGAIVGAIWGFIFVFQYMLDLIGYGLERIKNPDSPPNHKKTALLFSIPIVGFLVMFLGLNIFSSIIYGLIILVFFVAIAFIYSYFKPTSSHKNKAETRPTKKVRSEKKKTDNPTDKKTNSVNAERSADHEQKG